MKLGVLTACFADMSLDDVIKLAKSKNLGALELGTGNYPGSPHVDLEKLLGSDDECKKFKAKFDAAGLEISALSCHGNMLHPDPAIGKAHTDVARKTIQVAQKLGVRTVVDFSGCPGSDEDSKKPNWVTCPWPPDFGETLEWQWDKKVIPFWKEHAKFAENHGVKIAIEMHPGFVCYSPETLMRLRAATSETVGANLDPSHLFWQGIDNVRAVYYLGKAIHYVHAKDTYVNQKVVDIAGCMDTKHYGDLENRAWLFRTCGWGHGRDFWSQFASALRIVGYDHVLSIEHEDSMMSSMEGFSKAVDFLQDIIINEKPGAMFWA